MARDDCKYLYTEDCESLGTVSHQDLGDNAAHFDGLSIKMATAHINCDAQEFYSNAAHFGQRET